MEGADFGGFTLPQLQRMVKRSLKYSTFVAVIKILEDIVWLLIEFLLSAEI